MTHQSKMVEGDEYWPEGVARGEVLTEESIEIVTV